MQLRVARLVQEGNGNWIGSWKSEMRRPNLQSTENMGVFAANLNESYGDKEKSI